MFKQFQKYRNIGICFEKPNPNEESTFVGKIGPTFDKYFFVFARQKDEILKAGDEILKKDEILKAGDEV